MQHSTMRALRGAGSHSVVAARGRCRPGGERRNNGRQPAVPQLSGVVSAASGAGSEARMYLSLIHS